MCGTAQGGILPVSEHHDLAQPEELLATGADSKTVDLDPQVAALRTVARGHPEWQPFAGPRFRLSPLGDEHVGGELRIV